MGASSNPKRFSSLSNLPLRFVTYLFLQSHCWVLLPSQFLAPVRLLAIQTHVDSYAAP